MPGLGNIGPLQLLLLLLIVVLIFGTKRLRGIGSDLGSAIRDFRKGVSDGEQDTDAARPAENTVPDNESSKND